MFVRALGVAWAGLIELPPRAPDAAVDDWLAKLAGADPAQVASAVVAAPDELAVGAVVELLTRARDQLPDGTGELLRQIVRNGHGTGFPRGELAEAHAHFLTALELHLAGRLAAHRGYQLAALSYRSHGARTLTALAEVAVAATARAASDGDPADVRARLRDLAGHDPAMAAALTSAAEPHLKVLAWIAAAAGKQAAGEQAADARVAGPEPVDAEGVALLRAAVAANEDDTEVALRLARAADAASGAAPADSARALLARAWAFRRRWVPAAALLDELRAADPADRGLVVAQAIAYAGSDRWPEGKAKAMAVLGDPPAPADLPLLETLSMLAFQHDDPDAATLRQLLIGVDPGADPFAGLPQPARRVARQPLRAAFQDGQLNVSTELFDLPEEEQPIHLTAAVVAGSPDGADLLRELQDSSPELAAQVLALLGWRAVTPAQAEAQRRFEAGEHHFGQRRLDEAQREYEAAVRLDPDHAAATMYLGDVWYLRGAYHLAHAYFAESLAIDPSPQAHRFLGDALLRGGHGARRARAQYEAALALDPGYRGARQALDQLGPRPVEELPAPTDLMRELAEGVEHAGQAGPQRTSGDRLRAAMIEREGPDSLVAVADDPAAFRAWLASADPADLVRGLMAATTFVFIYHMKDRDVAKWRRWVEREMAMAEALPADFGVTADPWQLGRDRHVAGALHSLAVFREHESRLPEARLLYERSLELLTAAEDARRAAGLAGESEYDRLFHSVSVRAVTLEQLSDVCRKLGDHEAAATALAEAAQLRQARPTTEVEAAGFIGAGLRRCADGDLDGGLALLLHALYLVEDEDPMPMVPRAITTALTELGRGYRQAGLARAPLALFQRARRLNERTGNAHRLAHDHRNIAGVLRQRPELGGTDGVGDARGHLEQALGYASVLSPAGADELGWRAADGRWQRISAPDRAWPILLDLGDLLGEQGDDEAAARFLLLATRISDLVRAALTDEQQRIRVQNEQIAAYAKLARVHVRLATAGGADAARHAEAAWLTNESMRARTFLDVLGEADLTVPREIPAELVGRERELLDRRARLRRSGGQDLAFWESYREVAGELDAVWGTIRATVPQAEGYVEVRQGDPADPRDLAGLLRDGAARPAVLASLVRLDDETLGVLAVRDDHAAPIVETRPADLPRLERFVRQNFGSAGRVRELATDLEDLFQYELSAVAGLLAAVADPADVLVVCPFGVLHHVPLGALRHGPATLLERNPLALLPSASLLRAVRSAARHDAAVPAAVLGDPTGDLSGARTEALAVAARFGVPAALGADATVAAARAGLTRAGLLHVAAHARFDAGDPLASGLRLADGVLSARDVLTLRAPALSLVTLSACETGVSATDRAEELVGLSRALLFAGADALLLSLWRVPDEPTGAIMEAFYGARQRGAAAVDALRGAVLAARDKYGHDRLDRWAGFQLIGDWR